MKLRMVDSILGWEAHRSIRGTKCVSFEEYNLPVALGAAEQLPPVLALQSAFELAAWLVIVSSDFTRLGLVVQTQKIEFQGSVRPGQRMLVEVVATEYGDDSVIFDAAGCVGTRSVLIANGCVAKLHPLADYHDPDDLRTLWSEIHRPPREIAPAIAPGAA